MLFNKVIVRKLKDNRKQNEELANHIAPHFPMERRDFGFELVHEIVPWYISIMRDVFWDIKL